ncbi:MAG: hypothetical protein M5R37_12575 [Melioribacteraceae bacterium]|nr:hypothetical protein [Melioribacteraceae bacterium]
MIFFIITLCSFSQQLDSLLYGGDIQVQPSLTSLFDKRLNTYSLNTNFNYNHSWDKYKFTLFDNFRSTVIKSNTNSIKDENYFSFSNQYAFFDFLALGIRLNNNTFSDDRRLSINKTSVLHGEVFAEISPLQHLKIIPFGGISHNQQVALLDKGLIYGTLANLSDFRFDNIILKADVKFQNEDISPRKNTFRLIKFDIATDIESEIFNNFSARFSEQRRDFYFESDSITSSKFNITNNIQSRTEDQYQIHNRLFYFSPLSNFSVDLNGRIYWRNIDRATRYVVIENVTQSSFDTKIEEFKIDFNISGTYRLSDFRTSAKINYSEKDEKHSPKAIEGVNQIFFDEREKIESQKNNSAKLVTLTLQTEYDLSSSDHFTLSLFHRKLVYDTPSDLNFDDRDELLSTVRLRYLRNINYFFDLFINLEGSLNKIVYIFAERSSNNNIKRFIKLASGGVFKNRNIISSNSAEVSANYTVYDFEELNPNFKSFSFRQFAFRDSTVIKFSNKLKSEIQGYVKLSEQGDFKWSNFSNQPVRFLEEIFAEPKLFYTIGELELGIGLRFFELSTYNYNSKNEKVLSGKYSSIRPLTDIRFIMNNRLRLKIYGYYEFITSESGMSKEQANLNLQVDWIL